MKRVLANLVMILAVASLAYGDFESVEGTAPWGHVKVTVDRAAFQHFPLVGWIPNMVYGEGMRMFTFQYAIDTNNKSKDYKGCLRATFYSPDHSGRETRTMAMMTDWFEMKAMSMEAYGFLDATLDEWTHVIVQYTPVCSDTGKRFKLTRPAWAK